MQTLRYYERCGLVPETTRSAGNYRQYDEDLVDRVIFIKRAQALHFELAEIRALLCIRDQENGDPDAVRALVGEKVSAIDHKLAELSGVREALAALVATCERRNDKSTCPILAALTSGDPTPHPDGDNEASRS